MSDGAPRVVFVCWGNICRSPMAERVARQWFEDAGIVAHVTSAGVSSEEVPNGIDRRARRVLEDAGYDPSGHRARQIGTDELEHADLVIAAEEFHAARMRHLAPDATIRLISEFDPQADPGDPLPDPWYGDHADFLDTLEAIERAMPAIIDAVRDLR